MIKIIAKKTDEYNLLATHPLQSWEWGEFRQKQGHKTIRFGQYKNDKLVAVGQVTFHCLPKTNISVGYFPKGPLPNKEVIEFLTVLGRQNKAIFIKLEPEVAQDSQKASVLTKLGLKKGKSLFTKYTSVIDLSKTEEQILASFKSKTRYNIRLAEKHHVEVKEDNSDKAFDQYLKLLFETTSRQGFFAHDKKFHLLQWQILKPAGISHLLVATYKKKFLAAFLLFAFNKKLYYPYGASTRENKELMAPSLLMWEAIRFGKSQGCTLFDLWGDLEPNPAPDNPYFGFHRFKEGFSPRLVEYLGTYDLVINPFFYRFYQTADLLRWKLLKLKAKK